MNDSQAILQLCPKCNSSNEPWAKFCNRCGRKLVKPIEKKSSRDQEDDRDWDPRLQQGTQALKKVTEEVNQAVQQALSGTRKLLDSTTGSPFRLEGSALHHQIERIPLQITPYVSPAIEVKQQTCLRCGVDLRPGARFCPTCGERYYESWGKPLVFQAAVVSDQGLIRSNNEDNARLVLERHGMICLAMIADGMGGHNAGDVASREAVEAIMRYINEKVLSPDRQVYPGVELPKALNHAVQYANSTVFKQASQNSALRQMGTTITIALLQDDRAYLAHVGDSRAYLVNRNGTIWQITQDHTLVASLVAIGQISATEAATHPQRSVLYRSVGVEPNITVDTYIRRLYNGDRLVICSDGLTRYIQPLEIVAQVGNHAPPNEACARLVELANKRGGEDNISVIVIDVSAGG